MKRKNDFDNTSPKRAKKRFLTDPEFVELMKSWHPTLNHGLDPSKISYGSDTRVYWICHNICSNSPECKHVWQTRVNTRTLKNANCPFCAPQAKTPCCIEKSLGQSKYKEILSFWHPTRNGNVKPQNITPSSEKSVWWFCPKSCGESCKHEWQTQVGNITRGRGKCPFCASNNAKICCINTSLANPKYKAVADQWDYEKNYPITPKDVSPCSNIKFWWKCSNTCSDSSDCQHSWKTCPNHRIRGSGCPFCDIKRNCVCCQIRSLDMPQYKHITDDWCYRLNGDITPRHVRPHSTRIVWWECLNSCGSNCKHIWKTSIGNRQKQRCPYCAGRTACCIETSLKNPKYMHIVEQIHSTLNPKLNLDKINFRSDRKIWFECPNTCDYSNCNHIWKSTIQSRTKRNQGCPYCAGNTSTPCCRLKSLGHLFPEIAKEYDDEKNTISKYKIRPKSSTIKVWWICSRNLKHSWQTDPCHRTSRQDDCPLCSMSRMEKEMTRLLTILDIPFQTEVRIDPSFLLRVDFLVSDSWVIEMDGEQHFDPLNYFCQKKGNSLKKQQKRDQLKNEICKKKGLHLLRISHSIPFEDYTSIIQTFQQRIQNQPLVWQSQFVGKEYE